MFLSLAAFLSLKSIKKRDISVLRWNFKVQDFKSNWKELKTNFKTKGLSKDKVCILQYKL